MIHVPTAPWAHTILDLLAWAAGAATGTALYRWRLRGLTGEVTAKVGRGYFVALALGAGIGMWLVGSLNTLRADVPTLSHSVAGALAGAIVAVEIYKAARGIRGSTGGIFVGSLAAGIVVGRFGCFFAGLPDGTFGIRTTLPWGVDFGDGVARHPVQLYESAAMALFLLAYLLALRDRRPWALRRAFYVMCVWYGLQRFAWEFLKPYPPLFASINVFHVLCAGLVIYGCVLAVADSRRCAVPVPRPDDQPV
ncbi:MAG: prolipoprotein diacylglyceryl transferase family protein [Acetobacteraceae bacterium]|nr:prolipoprotein diacylglyceryl transferase [Pseudomonadota bacterium]